MQDGTSYPRVDMTPHWRTVQEHLLQIVDQVPDGKMSWTPKPELWNSRGILLHVADTRDGWLANTVQDGDPYPNIWTSARSKAEIKRELARTFERLERFLSNQAQLDATYRRVWDNDSAEHEYAGHWIAFHLLEHDIHHRAELLQRLALLGVEHGIDV